MSEFKRHRLADLYEISSGISTTKDQAGHGAPFVAFKDIYNNYFIPERLTELMDTTPEQQEKFSVREGDVFLTRTSETLDELAMSSVALQDHPNATFSGFAKRLRPRDPSNPDPRFMGFFLRSEYFRRIINSVTTMTTRASFNEAIFSHVEVDLPDLDSQVQIGDLLYSIEQQIELNNQVNDNLQAMLQTLYGYWFLQFDFPDENGRPYRSSGGRMVWNDQLKREIPAGWLVASITDHADVYQPKTISSRLFDDSHPFPVYGGGGYIGRFNQFNHQESEVIISCRGDCGSVYLTMPESWVTGNAMVVHPRGDCLPKEYLYLLLKNSNLEHYVTGSVQKQLTRQNFELLPILVPSRDVLERFTSFAKITISRQLEIVRENRKLQELRDWLLPMLMNGQATVTSSDKLLKSHHLRRALHPRVKACSTSSCIAQRISAS